MIKQSRIGMQPDKDIAKNYRIIASNLDKAKKISHWFIFFSITAVIALSLDHKWSEPIPLILAWTIVAIVISALANTAEQNALEGRVKYFWPLRITAHLALWVIGPLVIVGTVLAMAGVFMFGVFALGSIVSGALHLVILCSILSVLAVYWVIYGFRYFEYNFLILQSIGLMIEIRRQDRHLPAGLSAQSP